MNHLYYKSIPTTIPKESSLPPNANWDGQGKKENSRRKGLPLGRSNAGPGKKLNLETNVPLL